MASLLLTANTKRNWLSLTVKPLDEKGSVEKRGGVFSSGKTLFSNKGDDWREQITSTAGGLRPADDNFPWFLLSKHTDAYLEKKGKLSQAEVDKKLETLIWAQEARDIAIAACGYAMSPESLKAMLKIELNVTPVTYHGLEMYLQSLIAANHCNPQAVSDLEARWARITLPFATTGAGAAGKILEGAAHALQTTDIHDLSVLPHFSILTQNALVSYATHLRGSLLKCRWVSAHAAIAWMVPLLENTATVIPTTRLLPEVFLDSRFPFWRAWASWRPNVKRIASFDGIPASRRGVLPDFLALEGPDILTGRCPTLRDGIVSQYSGSNRIVKFRSLEIDVLLRSKDELKRLLMQLGTAVENILHSPQNLFDTFAKICTASPITDDTFEIMDALAQAPDTLGYPFHAAVTTIWPVRFRIGGQHYMSNLEQLLVGLNTDAGRPLRKSLVRSWLTEWIEKCFRECQSTIFTSLTSNRVPDLSWERLAEPFVRFCEVLRKSIDILSLQLSPEVRERLEAVPTRKFMQTRLREIYERNDFIYKRYAKGTSERSILTEIEDYCINRLTSGGDLSSASHTTIGALVEFWIQNKSPKRRNLAVMTSMFTQDSCELRLRCLKQIPLLSDSQADTIFKILREFRHDETHSCMALTKYLTEEKTIAGMQTWKDVLLRMLKVNGRDHTGHALEYEGFEKWLTWILELRDLFADVVGNPKASPPSVLRQETMVRAMQLCKYAPAITRFEKSLPPKQWDFAKIGPRGNSGKSPQLALQCLVEGSYPPPTSLSPTILDCLRLTADTPKESVLHHILTELSAEKSNNIRVVEAVCALHWASEVGVKACQNIVDSTKDDSLPTAVLEVIVTGWLESEIEPIIWDDEQLRITDGYKQMSRRDEQAIKKIAELYNITIHNGPIPERVLEEAAEYYGKLEEEIIEEAARLESIKDAMKTLDPVSTAAFLQKLGYPDITVLDQHMSYLPVDIIDAFEKRGEDMVEISFPLASFTELQRAATGIGEANTLIVHLYGFDSAGLPPSFCVHLDTDLDTLESRATHTPWVCLEKTSAPEHPYCKGRPSALTFQMSRFVHFRVHRWNPKTVSLAYLHSSIKERLDKYAHFCMICHNPLTVLGDPNIILRRPLPCRTCSTLKIWNDLPLLIRIPEIRTDPFIVDMLLTGLHAAATADRLDLLPFSPFTSIDILQILSRLPPLSVLQAAHNPSSVLKDYHNDAEKLLLYTCTYHRGLIASASGITKIRNLPAGTHQYLCANVNSRLESNFLACIAKSSTTNSSNPPTRVLFHGTSLDRLPSILAHGLRNYSGTALQRTGAAHGKGIYLAENPSLSFAYAPAAISWKNSGLSNMRVLLGCEVVGADNPVSGGVHVIKDETAVMVRYIFFCTKDAVAPYANHITTPMLSTMHALRSGAL